MRHSRKLGVFCASLLLLVAHSLQSQDSAPPTQRERDDALLEEYRSKTTLVSAEFWAIHARPSAGQGAVFRDFEGQRRMYRVAFLRENVCTVERQLPGSEVVVAVEFELTGAITRLVRRAWVGRKGEKPFAAGVAPVERGSSGVGLNGTYEDTNEPFTDFEQGGRKWSGTLTTTRFWKGKKQGAPDRITRDWQSEANWFKQSIRREVELNASETAVAELVEASDKFPPLLDWSDIPAPDAAENVRIRAPLIESAARGDLELLIKGNLNYGRHWGLHPEAKVGDWAVFGGDRLVLVKLEQGRGVIEASPVINELGLVEAMEFVVQDGKAIEVVARFAGLMGQAPQPAKLSTFKDQRPVEVVKGEPRQVDAAGRTWQARDVRTSRKSLQRNKPNASEEIIETVDSDDAPFGLPLSRKSYWSDMPERSNSDALTEVGKDGVATLDWSNWKPTPLWKAPFTAEEVKAFIKVGMRWRYSQEFDKGDEGKVTHYQDWKVLQVTDTGYRAEVVLTDPEGNKRTLEDSPSWDTYIKRVNSWPTGTIELQKYKVGDREIEVVLYQVIVWGKSALFGLSADLPGVRICTEEKLTWPSKVWLQEFHDAPPEEEK